VALRTLERLGARLEPVSLPRIGYAHAAALAIMLTEGTAVHVGRLATRAAEYGDDVRVLVELGLFVPGPAYVRALGGIPRTSPRMGRGRWSDAGRCGSLSTIAA